MREFWSVKAHGADLKKLHAAPDWYAQAKSSPYFTNVEPEQPASATATSSPVESASTGPLLLASYKSPNGSVELLLHLDMNEEDDQINGPGHGKHYLLRDLKTGTETEFSKVPGFYGAAGLLHNTEDKNLYFLFDGSLRVAFFDLHLNSTDGDTVFALDSAARDSSAFHRTGRRQFRCRERQLFSRLRKTVMCQSTATRKRLTALTWNTGTKN